MPAALAPLVSQQKPAASSGQLPQLPRGLELQRPVPAMAAVGHFTISSSISEGSPRLCGGSAALALSTALGTVYVKQGLAGTADATYLADAASWALEVTNARHCGMDLRNEHLGAGVFPILSKEATQGACSDPCSCQTEDCTDPFSIRALLETAAQVPLDPSSTSWSRGLLQADRSNGFSWGVPQGQFIALQFFFWIKFFGKPSPNLQVTPR